MNTLDYFKILPILITVLTFIIKYFNIHDKLYIESKEKYFKDVLAVYVSKLNLGLDINPIIFLKKERFEGGYFIPPYIWKLVNQNNKDDLHKILIVDYKNNYPNIENNEVKIINKISYILEIILMILFTLMLSFTFFVMFELAITAVVDLVNFIQNNSNTFELKNYLPYGIVLIISLLATMGLVFIIKKKLKRDDDYCMEKNAVDKNIEKKIKIYSDIIDKIYLINTR